MKKLIIILFWVASTVIATAQAPALQWCKQLTGLSANTSEGTSITTDASGNVYTLGYFDGTVDFNPGVGVFTLTAAGTSDIFITKLDVTGNFLWAIQMGGVTSNAFGMSIALDPSGNVYTTGYFDGTVDFDPGVPLVNLTALGTTDVFVSKLTSSGVYVWARQIGGVGADAYATGIAIDASGNVHTTGYFTSANVDFDPGVPVVNLTPLSADVFISKLSTAGTFIWVKQMESSAGAFATSIALDVSGAVYTTGNFFGITDFNPGIPVVNLTPLGTSDVFISKLTSTGVFVWARQMGGVGADADAKGIAIDNSGNVHTTGYFTGANVDFDPGAPVVNLTPLGTDVFISKLNTTGGFVWTRQLKSSSGVYANSIALDAAGAIYTTGNFFGATDFNPGIPVVNLTPLGTSDVFVSKLNSTGTFAWARQMGGVGVDVTGNSISVSASTDVYTTGWFNGLVDFDPDGGVYNLSTPNLSETFINKLSLCAVSAPTNTTAVLNSNICTNNTATLSVMGSGTLSWFATPTGIVALGTGTNYITPSLTTGTYTYFVESFSCAVSATRTAISITVNPLPLITAIANNTLLCVGQSALLTASGASTYTWNPGGVGANIAVNPIVTTNYTITGLSANSCSNTTVFTQSVSNCTGINKLTYFDTEVTIYPNPFSDKIIITSNGTKQIIQIFNTLGSLVYDTIIESEKTEIDLSTQLSGIYFIKIGSTTHKIIKE